MQAAKRFVGNEGMQHRRYNDVPAAFVTLGNTLANATSISEFDGSTPQLYRDTQLNAICPPCDYCHGQTEYSGTPNVFACFFCGKTTQK